MDKAKLALGLAVVAIVIAGIAFFHAPVQKALFGSTSCSDTTCLTGGLRILTGTLEADGPFLVGTNGTSFAAIKTGACTIWAPATTITATSTQQVECQGATNGGITAITGITADSVCQLVMASSTNTTLGSLAVEGASASSTAGTIVARVANFTGTTFTWTAAASSTAQWNYQCFDPS